MLSPWFHPALRVVPRSPGCAVPAGRGPGGVVGTGADPLRAPRLTHFVYISSGHTAARAPALTAAAHLFTDPLLTDRVQYHPAESYATCPCHQEPRWETPDTPTTSSSQQMVTTMYRAPTDVRLLPVLCKIKVMAPLRQSSGVKSPLSVFHG